MPTTLKLTTINIRGINNNIKKKRLLSLVKRIGMDVLLLQETFQKKEVIPILNSKNFPYQIHAPGSARARGIDILIKKSLRFYELDSIKDADGRYVITKGLLNNEKVTIASVYAPNTAQIEFLDKVLKKILDFTEGTLLVAGDFNYVANLNLDRTYKRGLANILPATTTTALHRLFEKYDFADCWQQLHPSMKDFTHYSAQHDVFTHLDYCLMLKSGVHKLQHSESGLKLLSDHNWVTCDIHLADPVRSGYNWVLNRNLMHSQLMRDETIKALRNYMDLNKDTDCKDQVGCVESDCKGYPDFHCVIPEEIRGEHTQKLLKTIQDLEERHKRTGESGIYQQLLQHRKALEALETDHITKNLIYLKQQHLHKSLKAIKLLAWRVRKRKADSMINFIETPQGGLQGKTEEILKGFEEYYTTLYTSKGPQITDIDYFFSNTSLFKTLSEQHKKMLDEAISEEEIRAAIKHLKNNKAAGPDGYPAKFFKTFIDILVPALEKTFNAVLLDGDVPPSWSEALLVPIPKPEKDKTKCESYRPIALLNVDLKIFKTILSNRLQKIISHYIHPDETGFIPGRTMSDNIRKTLNLIRHCKQQQIQSLLLALDFEKAFDSVEFLYLQRLLHHMGFGDNFKQAIAVMYQSPTAKLRINNQKSQKFPIGSGTRQGCPLSPLLFALCIEPLANFIRQDPRITGIRTQGMDCQVSLFAMMW